MPRLRLLFGLCLLLLLRGGTVAAKTAEVDPLATDARPRVAAQAAVLIKGRAGATLVETADLQKLVAGSVPGLAPQAVAVVVTTAADGLTTSGPAALMPLGPLRVSAGSRPLLVGALAAALALLAVLAALLLFTARRLAAVQRHTSPP